MQLFVTANEMAIDNRCFTPFLSAKELLAKSTNFGTSVLWSCGMPAVFE